MMMATDELRGEKRRFAEDSFQESFAIQDLIDFKPTKKDDKHNTDAAAAAAAAANTQQQTQPRWKNKNKKNSSQDDGFGQDSFTAVDMVFGNSSKNNKLHQSSSSFQKFPESKHDTVKRRTSSVSTGHRSSSNYHNSGSSSSQAFDAFDLQQHSHQPQHSSFAASDTMMLRPTRLGQSKSDDTFGISVFGGATTATFSSMGVSDEEKTKIQRTLSDRKDDNKQRHSKRRKSGSKKKSHTKRQHKQHVVVVEDDEEEDDRIKSGQPYRALATTGTKPDSKRRRHKKQPEPPSTKETETNYLAKPTISLQFPSFEAVGFPPGTAEQQKPSKRGSGVSNLSSSHTSVQTSQRRKQTTNTAAPDESKTLLGLADSTTRRHPHTRMSLKRTNALVPANNDSSSGHRRRHNSMPIRGTNQSLFDDDNDDNNIPVTRIARYSKSLTSASFEDNKATAETLQPEERQSNRRYPSENIMNFDVDDFGQPPIPSRRSTATSKSNVRRLSSVHSASTDETNNTNEHKQQRRRRRRRSSFSPTQQQQRQQQQQANKTSSSDGTSGESKITRQPSFGDFTIGKTEEQKEEQEEDDYETKEDEASPSPLLSKSHYSSTRLTVAHSSTTSETKNTAGEQGSRRASDFSFNDLASRKTPPQQRKTTAEILASADAKSKVKSKNSRKTNDGKKEELSFTDFAARKTAKGSTDDEVSLSELTSTGQRKAARVGSDLLQMRNRRGVAPMRQRQFSNSRDEIMAEEPPLQEPATMWGSHRSHSEPLAELHPPLRPMSLKQTTSDTTMLVVARSRSRYSSDDMYTTSGDDDDDDETISDARSMLERFIQERRKSTGSIGEAEKRDSDDSSFVNNGSGRAGSRGNAKAASRGHIFSDKLAIANRRSSGQHAGTSSPPGDDESSVISVVKKKAPSYRQSSRNGVFLSSWSSRNEHKENPEPLMTTIPFNTDTAVVEGENELKRLMAKPGAYEVQYLPTKKPSDDDEEASIQLDAEDGDIEAGKRNKPPRRTGEQGSNNPFVRSQADNSGNRRVDRSGNRNNASSSRISRETPISGTSSSNMTSSNQGSTDGNGQPLRSCLRNPIGPAAYPPPQGVSGQTLEASGNDGLFPGLSHPQRKQPLVDYTEGEFNGLLGRLNANDDPMDFLITANAVEPVFDEQDNISVPHSDGTVQASIILTQKQLNRRVLCASCIAVLIFASFGTTIGLLLRNQSAEPIASTSGDSEGEDNTGNGVANESDDEDTAPPASCPESGGSSADIFTQCRCEGSIATSSDGFNIGAYTIVTSALMDAGLIDGAYSVMTPLTSCAVENQAIIWLSNLENSPVTQEELTMWSSTAIIQRYVIVLFFVQLGGHQWDEKAKWVTPGFECEWFGVECDLSIRVSGINLPNNGLAGQIPSHLASLSSLTVLRLEGNQGITGTLPLELSSIRLLHTLDLNSCGVTGQLPTFEESSMLETLNVQNNAFAGTIPASYGSMGRLRNVDLSMNQLSGIIPSEMGNLGATLVNFDVGKNGLTGTLPEALEGLTNLLIFSVGQNRLSGAIPNSLGSLAALQRFNVQSNDFTGSVPSFLSDLTNLRLAAISGNKLTGPIPAGLCSASAFLEMLVVDCAGVFAKNCSCCRCVENLDTDNFPFL